MSRKRKYNLPKGVTSDRDRHGNIRLYFRNPPNKKVRIREKPGTKAFDKEVACARAGIPYRVAEKQITLSKGRIKPGSLQWLFTEYKKRAKGLVSEPLFNTRVKILEQVCLFEWGKTVAGELPYAQMQRRHIVKIRDALRDKPAARNDVVKALSALFAWAIDVGEMEINPAHRIKRLKAGDGFHTWTRDEIQQYAEHYPSGTKARLLMVMALFTGLRRQDLPLLGWQHVTYSQRDDDPNITELRIKIKPTKTSSSSGVWVDIPVHPVLAEELKHVSRDHLTFLITKYNKPHTVAGLGALMRKYCAQAKLAHCSLHGLRKASATIAAEEGATDDGLMSMFGWTTKQQTTLYTRQANRKKLANSTIAAIDIDLPSGTKKE